MCQDDKLPPTVARRWTRSAAECYELGCRCSECSIPLIMETPCRMKAVVLELVRKFGKPDVKLTKGDFNNGEFYTNFTSNRTFYNPGWFETLDS